MQLFEIFYFLIELESQKRQQKIEIKKDLNDMCNKLVENAKKRNITSIKLPDLLDTIIDYQFYNCQNIQLKNR